MCVCVWCGALLLRVVLYIVNVKECACTEAMRCAAYIKQRYSELMRASTFNTLNMVD